SLVGILFTVVLAPLLLKIYGMKGAAVATSISYLASTIYLAYYFYKVTEFKLVDFKVDLKELKALFGK
ncbi:MAG TPA: polysaccharide biosynthesis C-terminal domain-containing protein, partial [Bacteroidales bacterium]|nr:polysaccharide biosynthesis C-terminal domain-containing protein [Bacteroidales bacterium]